MTKQTKILAGVAVAGIAAYFILESTRKKGFVNAVGVVKCETGFEPVSIWTNYPKTPKNLQTGCFNKRSNNFYYPS